MEPPTWQCWAPPALIDNAAQTANENCTILSFLAKTAHAKNEKPSAFEGQAGGTGGNPLFQLHKRSFSYKLKLCIYSVRNRGVTSCLLKSKREATKTPGGRKGDPVQGNHYKLLGTLGQVSLQILNHNYIKEYYINKNKYTKDKNKN